MPKGSWREFEESSFIEESIQISSENQSKADRPVRVQKTKSGKGGKTVTRVIGLGLNVIDLKKLLKSFKAKCGTGGTAKEGIMELQGDQVQVVLELLHLEGFSPKRSGG